MSKRHQVTRCDKGRFEHVTRFEKSRCVLQITKNHKETYNQCLPVISRFSCRPIDYTYIIVYILYIYIDSYHKHNSEILVKLVR